MPDRRRKRLSHRAEETRAYLARARVATRRRLLGRAVIATRESA